MLSTRPSILYVATEDWFFCSHFLPMARAARDAGFDVAVACRVRDKGAAILAEGFRLIPVDAERGRLGPLSVIGNVRALSTVMRREKPALVHLIALRPIVLGGVAAVAAGVPRHVCAVTGLGPIGGTPSAPWHLARTAITMLMRRLAAGGRTVFLFENRDDPPTLGLAADSSAVAIVNGAGIDPAAFPATPLPPTPPLRAAMVARMLWSKGVDTAVAAVSLARGRGADVTLTLYGAPDPSNRTSISEATLREWATRPGIAWHGPTGDVAAVWRDHHVALLPSHGEGMPRALIEAGCCGRAMVATDVSGCRSLVSDGVDGILVPPGDAGALADALCLLADDPARVAAMGVAAMTKIHAAYTERDVGEAIVGIYRRLLREVA
jgi:glycosyltransferase involved in cell wall biosynthesis